MAATHVFRRPPPLSEGDSTQRERERERAFLRKKPKEVAMVSSGQVLLSSPCPRNLIFNPNSDIVSLPGRVQKLNIPICRGDRCTVHLPADHPQCTLCTPINELLPGLTHVKYLVTLIGHC